MSFIKDQLGAYLEELEGQKAYYDYYGEPYPEELEEKLKEWGMIIEPELFPEDLKEKEILDEVELEKIPF